MTDQWRVSVLAALVTAVTIAGAVFAFFRVVNDLIVGNVMSGLPAVAEIPLGVLLVVTPFLVGGGLWGWGIARLAEAPRRPAAKTGALSLTGMIFLLEAPVHMSQALPLPDWFPFGFHGAFTFVFMLEIALVAGVATTRLARRIGVDGPREMGRRVGLAGAGGFLVGSIVAFALGFEVGTPPAMNMVWALHVANLTAGLTAGWVLGWILATPDISTPDRQARASSVSA